MLELTLYGLIQMNDERYRKGFDNLFDADHRNEMLRLHGGTMAEIVKIEDLV